MTYREIGHCRIIDFRAAEAGALDPAELFDRLSWDEEARSIVILFDSRVDELLVEKAAAGESSCIELVAKLKQPTIAAIQGDGIGIGLELALACDIRIGIEGSLFGLNQVAEGHVPSNGGTQRLPRLIGPGRALQMILTGELIGAIEAQRTGLLHRVVAPDCLLDTALEVAQDMATRSPLSISYVKEALYSGRDLTLDQGLRMELDLYLLLFTTADRTEGITAFLEKRKPDFKGN